MKNDFLIINKNIAPENYISVIKARKLIEDNNMSVSNACLELGISRGTYYKYKDFVFLPSADLGKKAILSFLLDNKKGILSNLLNFIASNGGNVLTINQEMPIHGTAYVTITIDVIEIVTTIDEFIENVKKINGIESAKMIAME